MMVLKVAVVVTVFLVIAIGLRIVAPDEVAWRGVVGTGAPAADPGIKVWDASDGKREPQR